MRILHLLLLALAGAVLPAQTCVWGSFDASRVNYSGGVLPTGNHVGLRAAIAANGGTLAPATPSLTPAYLAGVNVFYTSLLNQSTGALSAAEQTALSNWIAAGGTLIVTGDIFPLAAYETFTQPFGVTNWTAISNSGVGSPVTTHPIVAGVSAYSYATNGTFTHGANARRLGNDSAGNAFMAVLEPATGFSLGGRILVLGDHNMFTDSQIGNSDNTALATNIAAWACGRKRCVWGGFDASRVNYAGGVLPTGNYVGLRAAIAASGGTLAPPTPSLTPTYLAGVDIFYTSLLNQSTGALSAAEQTALSNWIAAGGTLVVTGDIFPLAAYESFTRPFGVTNWRSISTSSTGSPVTTHPIVAGVSAYSYVTNGTFTFGADARRLGDDNAGNPFMAVLEPATGFFHGGRILVLGDHNMFTDNYIGNSDNTLLATNIAAWACNRKRCIWGGFDVSRVNYAGGVLSTGNHIGLRAAIASNGGMLAPPTPSLTPTYLAGVDVFYTSLLNQSTGALSVAEQTALSNWIAAGGTLIVTGDIFPLAAYESFTRPFGVTNWRSISTSSTGSPVTTHPIVAGVSAYSYVTNGTFTHGANARRLGDDNAGNPFMAVLEPASGFFGGGRILVLGDHNMFTDSNIGNSDNTRLANNIAAWACAPLCESASWGNYGAGWPGTRGVPSLTCGANPSLGSILPLVIQNSSGTAAAAVIPIGLASASLPTPFGGTLLVAPTLYLNLGIPAAGAVLPLAVPPNPSLCGGSLFLQAIQVDAGASHGLSFSPGLRLRLGS